MSVIHHASGADSIGFLGVASKSPTTGRVVERKYCETCAEPFYRDRPMMAALGEKHCPRHRRTIQPGREVGRQRAS